MARTGRPQAANHPADEELRRLYADERLSTNAIGIRLGFSATAINKWLRQAGIEIRPNAPAVKTKGSVVRICPTCGTTFWTWPSVIEAGRKTYCSQNCARTARGASNRGVKWTPERIAKRTESRKANATKASAEIIEERKAHRREMARAVNLAWKHGLTPEQFDALWDSQDGRCAICRCVLTKGTREVHVDHSHKTGAIRGILCGSCNRGLGMLKDSIDNLESALMYLRSHA